MVVSSHLVTRTYFGFENSPHRFDRITGWIENDALRTTFGSKDRVVENLTYASFVQDVQEFIRKEVIPKVSELEMHRLGRMEMKFLRKVDRKLASALAELLTEQPLELLQSGGDKIPPEALRSIMTPEKVIAQTGETSTVLIEESTEPVGSEAKSSSEISAASDVMAPDAGQSPIQTDAEWNNREEKSPFPSTSEPETAAQPMSQGAVSETKVSQPSSEPQKRRVGHYLHDLGVVVVPYDDEKDMRPSYSNKEYALAGHRVKAIFVNRRHPSYMKCEKDGSLVEHLLRLVSNELAGMGYEGSEPAMEFANRLYSIAVVKG